jgi:hypothetical protein
MGGAGMMLRQYRPSLWGSVGKSVVASVEKSDAGVGICAPARWLTARKCFKC